MTSVALVHPYWDFWAASVPGDLLADRRQLLRVTAESLGADVRIAVESVVGTEAEAAALAEACADAEVLVLVSTMAVPPATTMALVSRLPDLPIVVWALHEHSRLPGDFSHSDITTQGATVGAPMIVSALARAGRRYDVVMSDLRDVGQAQVAIRAAGAAGAVRGSTLLRIGSAMPGYTSVVASEDDLAGLGIASVTVDPAQFADRALAVDVARVAHVRAEICSEFDVDPAVDPRALDRIARVEAALADLVQETGAAAGALNCHIPQLRYNQEIGVCPCVALGRLTSRGVPWTCSGDVVTSVAMLSVQALGLPTLYHEIEAVDYERDEVVLANTGEHDRRLAPAGPIPLAPDAWYIDDPIVSPCAQFSIPASAASLVGFAPLDGLRWIVAEGEFTGSRYPLTGTPNAGFRFSSGHVTQAWPRWLASGVVHHSAATNAHVADLVTRMAGHLGAHVITV